MRPVQLRARVLASVAIAAAAAASLGAQTPSPETWAGWARCQVNVQGPGYTDQQTHTWAITSAAPTVEGAFRVYAGTWSVVGGGSLQRVQGTQRLTAQWSTNGQSISAPIAVFVRASDGRMFVQARHAQLRAPGAIAGYQQQTIDGTPQPPGQIAAEAFEWAFPVVDGAATSTALNGSTTPPVNGSVGLMQPAGSQGTASCTWQFGRGAAAPPPPPAVMALPAPVATPLGPASSAGDRPVSGGAGVPAAPPVAGTPTTVNPTFTPTSTPPSTSSTTTPTTTAVPSAPPAPAVPARERVAPTLPRAPAPATGPAPPATPPPSLPGTGVYLVSVTGLICGQPTTDTVMSGLIAVGDPDGPGDEVYAAAYVRRFDRKTFQLLENTVRQTLPYGDITSFGTSRLQAGTQTPTGGIRAGDRIPSNLTVARTFPAQESSFPWKVWEGRLTAGADALLISPGVWEYDGGSTVLQEWVQSQSVLNNTIFMDAAVQNRVGSQVLGALEVGTTVPTFPRLPQLIIDGRQDRPIGLRPLGSGAALPNITIVLTREIVEQALATEWARVQLPVVPGLVLDIPKPGILVLNFSEISGANRPPTAYSLILQVEKLSD